MAEERRLYRSSKDKVICGLCGGLGEYFNVDPMIVRIAFVLFFTINPVAATLFYILACAIIPKAYTSKTGKENSVTRKTIQYNQGLIFLGLMLILVGVLVFPEIKLILRSVLGGLAIATGLLIILIALFRRENTKH